MENQMVVALKEDPKKFPIIVNTDGWPRGYAWNTWILALKTMYFTTWISPKPLTTKIVISYNRWWLIWMRNLHTMSQVKIFCHNPSLGLATKVRACKGVGQEWSSGITFHVSGNVRQCEGMNAHTPKWAHSQVSSHFGS